MGGLLSINMEANYKKNKAFIDEMSSMAMERQLQTQNAMIERQIAMTIAGSREFFKWMASFYATAASGLITRYRKTRNPTMLVSLVPLTYVVAYYWDLAYGTKMDRIRLDAETVMAEERARLGFPYGLPTYQAVEKSVRTKEELAHDTEIQLQAANKYKIVQHKLEEQKAVPIILTLEPFKTLKSFFDE